MKLGRLPSHLNGDMGIERKRYNEPSAMGKVSASLSVSGPDGPSGWADQKCEIKGKEKSEKAMT